MGETSKAVRAYLAGIGRKGAETRVKRYSHRQLSQWSKSGGRPRALTPEGMRKLVRLKKSGLTQEQIASELGVSLSTVARAQACNREESRQGVRP
jgi:DNA-binding NarL/FixJ family response regulator